MKRGPLERAVEMMESEFVECIRLAEDKDDMAYVHKGLGLKRKSTETKDNMKVVEKEMQGLEEKRRNLLQQIVYFLSYVFFKFFFFIRFFRFCFPTCVDIVLSTADCVDIC